MPTPRIVFYSTLHHVRWGGSEELWSRAALSLAQRGVAVGACVHGGWAEPASRVRELLAAGVDVHFRARRRGDLARRISLRLTGHRTATPAHLRLLAWLRRFRPDLVVVSQGGTVDGAEFIASCQALALPYVALSQMNAENYWPTDEAADAVSRAYQGAVKSFFVSRRNLELLETQLGESVPNAEIVRNPLNVPVQAALPWPADKAGVRLACVARLDPNAKGQDLLLHLMALPKWRERPVRVDFFGEGVCGTRLRKLASRLGLSNVHFAGQSSDIPGVWAEHQLIVLPSRYEGLPLALVEAMYCGRPAVVTDVAGNTEVVTDGMNGFVAAAATVTHLDEALERAWTKRERWPEMGICAAKSIRELIPSDPVERFAEQLSSLL